MWCPDEFLEQTYIKTNQSLVFKASNVKDWSVWRESLKSKLTEVLGVVPNKSTNLNPQTIERKVFEEYIRERVEYSVDELLRVPAYLLIPKNSSKPMPAVIVCHGHGYGSKEVVGLQPDGINKRATPGLYNDFAVNLVRKGYVVLVPEVIGFGDRRLKEDVQKDLNENSCFRLATYLLMLGKTLAGQRVYEVKKGIDFINTRIEVDATRIACMGFSGGGQICAYASAVDERIKAVIVSGYTNTFLNSILSIRHCIDNYLPGLVQYAEMPDIIGLIAPRPLFIESGEEDPLFPEEGVHLAYSKIKKIYETLGKIGNLEWDHFRGGHEVNGMKSLQWLDSHL